jgi:type IV secretory pathway VirB6-like protein
MKKSAAFVILFLFALLVWNVFTYSGDMAFNFDGDEVDGPLGALLGMLFAGGGLLLAGVAIVVVGAILAVVFAGVGILCLVGLAIGAIVVALAISPLLLPLFVLGAIVWWLSGRSRKSRVMQQPV